MASKRTRRALPPTPGTPPLRTTPTSAATPTPPVTLAAQSVLEASASPTPAAEAGPAAAAPGAGESRDSGGDQEGEGARADAGARSQTGERASLQAGEGQGGAQTAACERERPRSTEVACARCRGGVERTGVEAAGAVWHSACFVCELCGESLLDVPFVSAGGRPYCDTVCMNGGTAPRCHGCKQDMQTTVFVRSMGRLWHTECLLCSECSVALSSKFIKAKDKAFCSVACVKKYKRRRREARKSHTRPTSTSTADMPALVLPERTPASGSSSSSPGRASSGSASCDSDGRTPRGFSPAHSANMSDSNDNDEYEVPAATEWKIDSPLKALEAWLLAPPFVRLYRVTRALPLGDRSAFMDALANVAVYRQVALPVLKIFIDNEVSATEDYTTLFRTDSPLTKFMKQFAVLIGRDYLEASIGPMVLDLVFRSVALEIDPQRMGEMSPEAAAAAQAASAEALTRECSSFLAAILFSSKFVPLAFRVVCQYLQAAVARQWPSRPEFVYRALGGFLFLRFYCPAIVSPSVFGLVDETPARPVRRTLVLVAKTLQNMANGVTPPASSPMNLLNSFCAEQQVALRDFFDDFVRIDDETSPGATPDSPVSAKAAVQAMFSLQRLLVGSAPSIGPKLSARAWAALASLLILNDPLVPLPDVERVAMAAALEKVFDSDGDIPSDNASHDGPVSANLASRLRSASRFMGSKLTAMRAKRKTSRPESLDAMVDAPVAYDVIARFDVLRAAFLDALDTSQYVVVAGETPVDGFLADQDAALREIEASRAEERAGQAEEPSNDECTTESSSAAGTTLAASHATVASVE
mgnify:CR=1 FL=1